MTVLSNVIPALALQTGTALPPPAPPPPAVQCILAIAAVGDAPNTPFASFNYYADGVIRIERELPESAANRDVDDLVMQMDTVWYAQGRATINMLTGSGPSAQGAIVPHLRIPVTSTFATALSQARKLTLWDKDGRKEQFDLGKLDPESIANWRNCIAASPPSAGSSSGAVYQPQAPNQALTPLNKQSWITVYDYPSRLIRSEVTGTVVYRLDVSANGRVKNCITDPNEIDTGGAIVNNVPELNDATCKNILRRARFLPATDGSGRPYAAEFTGRVRWVLPQ